MSTSRHNYSSLLLPSYPLNPPPPPEFLVLLAFFKEIATVKFEKVKSERRLQRNRSLGAQNTYLWMNVEKKI